MNHCARRNRLKLRLGIPLIVAACLVSRVHADYLGPNRTYVVTTYETCDYGIWAKPGNCTDSSGNPSDCTIGDWECDPGDPPDDGAYYYALGTTVVERSTTHTDPEATITGFVQCASPGENGWCIVPAALALSAHEPVAGKSILLIEGRHNGEPFACQSDSCTVNAVEGMNEFSYWALSNYGDSTQMGQTTIKQDTRPPVIDASLNGSLGDNGWFITEPILTVAVRDPAPGSGIAQETATDGATAFSIAAPYTITEGVHPITLSVKDHAGLTTTLEDTVSVDLTAPTLSGNYSLPVRNGYHKGTITFYGSAGDAMSGITDIEIAPDGEVWRSVGIGADGNWRYDWNSLEHADGSVTPQLLARDRAGNETILTLPPLTIDNQPPTLTGNDIPMEHAGFNHGLLAFSGTATDSQSGVERLEFAPDGSAFHSLNLDARGRWAFNWDSREHADGEVTPVLKAMDIAGNESAISLREYHLDNSPPELTAREILREAGGYNHGNIPFSGTAYDWRAGIKRLEFAPDGVRFRTISADENQRWAFTWESWERDDGGVVPVLRAVDFLGNAAEIRLREFQLDNSAPELFLTSAWYIWEKGHVYVKDERAGIQGIGLSVRDDQKRWAAREYGYERNPLDIDFKWDRRFGDENRTIAPVGSYEVLLEACDLVGNCTDVTGRIYVPARNDVPPLTRTSWAGIPLPTRTRTPTAIATATQQAARTTISASATATVPFPTSTRQAAVIVPTKLPSRTPRPTAAPGQYVFLGNIPKNSNPAPAPDPLPVDPNLLTGMAAVTAAASATATALFMRRKREEELRRIADESCAEAEARARAANRQRIITNLQNQERMANPDKYRNISTDQIPFDERKVAYNEGFISAAKAGLIKPEKVSKAVAETKKKLLERQVSSIILNSIREGRSPSKYWVVRNGKAYPKLAAFQDGGHSEAINVPEQISQNVSEIYELYGFNGCGPVSVCEAISNLTNGDENFLDCVLGINKFVPEEINIKENGIQPSVLNVVLNNFGKELDVKIKSNPIQFDNFEEAVEELKKINSDPQKVAILDILVCSFAQTLTDCAPEKSFAHFVFLREIGDDHIIVSETLSSSLDANNNFMKYESYINSNNYAEHVRVDFETLRSIWKNPEQSALKPSKDAEKIDYWMLVIEKR